MCPRETLIGDGQNLGTNFDPLSGCGAAFHCALRVISPPLSWRCHGGVISAWDTRVTNVLLHKPSVLALELMDSLTRLGARGPYLAGTRICFRARQLNIWRNATLFRKTHDINLHIVNDALCPLVLGPSRRQYVLHEQLFKFISWRSEHKRIHTFKKSRKCSKTTVILQAKKINKLKKSLQAVSKQCKFWINVPPSHYFHTVYFQSEQTLSSVEICTFMWFLCTINLMRLCSAAPLKC